MAKNSIKSKEVIFRIHRQANNSLGHSSCSIHCRRRIFYYWFYFIKGGSLNLQTIIMKKDSATSQTNSTANQAQQQTNNTKTKFSQWTLDPNLDKLAAKLAIKKYVNEFVASSLDNSNPRSEDCFKRYPAHHADKISELFDFQLPSVISDKLTDDYSIFTIKENGEPRMGAVFELQNADSLTDAMKNNESTLVSELKPFYLDANHIGYARFI